MAFVRPTTFVAMPVILLLAAACPSPAQSTSTLPEVMPLPDRTPQRPAAPSGKPAPDEPVRTFQTRPSGDEAQGAGERSCEAALDRLQVRYRRIETIDGEGVCGIEAPYHVESIAGVELRPDAALTCQTALALARWIATSVRPAARALGDDIDLARITHASAYACRSRNNSPGEPLSEHALGRAIDVASFSFEGFETIAVTRREGEGNLAEAFQKAVRAGACLHFTTVIGPASDRHHDDHFHLDTRSRSGGFRLCQ